MKNKLVYLFMVLLLVNVGCKEKVVPAGKPVAQKPAASGTAAPAVVQKEEPKVEKEIYVYDPKGRRDPFASLAQVSKRKAERKIGSSPIESYDVNEIKLVAIAWDSRQYYALITLPDNKSYTIRKGMTLGLYSGKVEEITRDSVIVREQVKDYRGQTKIKDTILKLRKEGEE
jgi:type IV pilus assembly protein PilP